MEFPEQPRAVYNRNPLSEVVCQLRFPRLFLLDRQVPAEFQSALGREFPVVDSREEFRLSFSEGSQNPTPTTRRLIYDFSTTDDEFTVSLCSDFLAIKTYKYVRWERFQSVLNLAMKALLSNYEVVHFKRIGLRYVNIIDRDELGLKDETWSNLLRTRALGLLADQDIPINDVTEQATTTVIKLNEGKVAVRTGLSFVNNEEKPQFIVDSDFFFEEQVEGAEDAIRILGSYNRAAGNVFRWFITDRLHNHLEPTDP
ncbi:TIGR04255 family protein [Roseovarius atlanticus]|nr:TIGR04255 family protein [Roseovarius atlanticus]